MRRVEDGAYVYVTYTGVVEFNERAQEAMSGGAPTEYGEIRFINGVRFETGDPRYAWLNSTVAVAQGRVVTSAVEYNVYEVKSG